MLAGVLAAGIGSGEQPILVAQGHSPRRPLSSAVVDLQASIAATAQGGARWVIARVYLDSKQRACELPFFMHCYNWHRPHVSIRGTPSTGEPWPRQGQIIETPHVAQLA